MKDFPRYTSGDRAFNFFHDALDAMEAGARVGARVWASKTAIKIRCKSFSEYLKTSVVAARALVTEGFVPEGLAG